MPEPGPPSTWRALCPADPAARPAFAAALRVLADDAARAELARGALERAYPEGVLERLWDAGLAELWLAPDFVGLTALNEATAAVDGAIAITLGVTSLALLPTWAWGSEAQLERAARVVRERGLASLLLTELDAGSDLLAARTRARRAGDGTWRLDGQKDLINGASRHRLLTVLARTRDDTPGRDPIDRAADFTVFAFERAPGVRPGVRWHTSPAPGADIGSVDLDGVVVGDEHVLAGEGEGFAVVQRTLTLSRGGVSGLSAGAAAAARRLALQHARGRSLYGAPIARLPAIAEHVARVAALEAACAALSVEQALLVNAVGAGAAHYTAAAKYACARLAEEAVVEAQRVLGGRALLEAYPFARLARDVQLYGVFDGTSHVMLEQLARRLGGKPSPPAALAAHLAAPPAPLVAVARRATRAFGVALAARAEGAPEPLPAAAAALAAVAAAPGLAADQALAHAAADALARLEALAALHDLAHPPRRAALGLPALLAGPALAELAASHDYALAWLGGRVLADLVRLAARLGLPAPAGAADALAAAARGEERARAAWRDLL
jgi:alkylation response protein AidB-like acyl-CoA dehydrogenase